MAPINPSKVSLLKEAKDGLISLVHQIVIIFLSFSAILLTNGGQPSAFVITLTFLLSIAFVAWLEQRRIIRLRVEAPFLQNFISDLKNSSQVEWNVAEWFNNKRIPENARQRGGWSLKSIRVDGLDSSETWSSEVIYSPAASQENHEVRQVLLKKNLTIQGIEYVLYISKLDHSRWQLGLMRNDSNTSVPENFELRIIDISNKSLVREFSKSPHGQKCISVETSGGSQIVWDIEPRPDNYSPEILFL